MDEELLPSISCRPGCHDCCGPVPFDKRDQEAAIAAAPLVDTGGWVATEIGMIPAKALKDLSCPYLMGERGCGIYSVRPKICRAFGVVDDPVLTCPHVPLPDGALSSEQGRTYMGVGK